MESGTDFIVAGGGVGFFGMLIIGFLAGWIAERVMNRDHGILTNILVGIAGSFVGGTASGLLGISYYGHVGHLVIATLGAIAILWFFGRRERSPHTHRHRDSHREDREPTRHEELDQRDNTPIYHAKRDKK